MTKKDYYLRVMKDSLIFAFAGMLWAFLAAALAPNPGNIIIIKIFLAEIYVSYAASVLGMKLGFMIAALSLSIGIIFTVLYRWGK